jgi:hypothetical protein
MGSFMGVALGTLGTFDQETKVNMFTNSSH